MEVEELLLMAAAANRSARAVGFREASADVAGPCLHALLLSATGSQTASAHAALRHRPPSLAHRTARR
jgi:hypothetical protein